MCSTPPQASIATVQGSSLDTVLRTFRGARVAAHDLPGAVEGREAAVVLAQVDPENSDLLNPFLEWHWQPNAAGWRGGPFRNVGNFMGTLLMPKAAESWSLTSLREKLIMIGARVVARPLRHLPIGQGGGVAADVHGYPAARRAAAGARAGAIGRWLNWETKTVKVRLDERKAIGSSAARPVILGGRRWLRQRPKSGTITLAETRNLEIRQNAASPTSSSSVGARCPPVSPDCGPLGPRLRPTKSTTWSSCCVKTTVTTIISGSFAGGDGKMVEQRCSDTQPDPPHSRAAALSGVRCHHRELVTAVMSKEIFPTILLTLDNLCCATGISAKSGCRSYPNYFSLMGVWPPILDNPKGNTAGRFDQETIADRLTARGVSWRNYNGGIAMVRMFAKAAASGNIVPVEQFHDDARAGALPAVSWITPALSDSEHPPYSVRHGESWAVNYINSIMRSPVWPRTVVIVVWDEWGGFADHVTPPTGEGEASSPVRYGYRIPCLVIGGYAKHAYVSHTLYSHTSIVKTICRLFSIPTANWIEERANGLLDCLAFTRTPQAPLLLQPRSS